MLGDPSVAIIAGTISGTSVTYSTVSTSSNNWGQFLGACIGASNGVTNATIPDPANSGVMREAFNTANLYQTTYPQFISGGWKTDGTTYDIEMSGTTQYNVSANGTYNIKGSILYSPLAFLGQSNTSSKAVWTNVTPDSAGNFTCYVGKNNTGEQVGMLSYIKIKQHASVGGSSKDQPGVAVVNNGNSIKDPVSVLFPNPTTGQFKVYLSTPQEEAKLVLLDGSGRVLQQRTTSGSQIEMNIARFPAGTYTLRVQKGNNVFTYKIVKQ